MHYRHLKRIARGESRLNIDAKWKLTQGEKGYVRSALIDTMQEVIFAPQWGLKKFFSCNPRQDNPSIWIRVELERMTFACKYNLIDLALRLLNMKEDTPHCFQYVRMASLMKCVSDHLIWKLEQQGMKRGLAKYIIKLKGTLHEDQVFIKLNNLLITYMEKTYGNKKRTPSQHKKPLRIFDK